MPSGPKKRLRARRKKQGSPATDANSDRETLSVTGSVDVDDLESGLDTPVKGSSRSAFLDSEAVSSQTDEWVRVSDFDVGTPTSLAEENDPSAEDGDTGSSRRSVDKLAEWETVSGENIPGRQGGSINSLEEEQPSECEVASAHSSESYTNLPSPHVAERDKDGDSSDSDVKNRIEAFDSSASVDVGEDLPSPRHEPPLPPAEEGQIEEIDRLREYSPEEKITHDADEMNAIVDDTTTSKETTTQAPSIEDEANPVGGAHKQSEEKVPMESIESALSDTKPDDHEMVSANDKGTGEGDTPVPEETPIEEKEVPHTPVESVIQGGISGDEKSLAPGLNELGGKEEAVAASPVDVEDQDVLTGVSTGEKVAGLAIDNTSAADGKEVASTSSNAEEEKSLVDDSNFEVANFVEKTAPDSQELAADSLSVKPLPTSGTSEPMALVEERHLSVSTLVEKNGTEKRLLEAKSLTGCCGVLYWLLGWDH